MENWLKLATDTSFLVGALFLPFDVVFVMYHRQCDIHTNFHINDIVYISVHSIVENKALKIDMYTTHV